MSYTILDVVLPLLRWMHIVCTTLIVGGTLFYELVVPIASEDLKREQQLYLFARARLAFRWIVWIATAGLLVSGAASLWRMWEAYQTEEFTYVFRWALAHMAAGVAALVIALLLTIGRRPPDNPVGWMRLNLTVLLVVIFLGASTRHFQLALREREDMRSRGGKVPTTLPMILDRPATGPTTP